VKVLIAQLNPTIGDLDGNAYLVIEALKKGKEQQADLVLFPEMILTGYPPEDLLLFSEFIDEVEFQLQRVVLHASDIAAIIGLPRRNPHQGEKGLLNSAAIIQDRKILGFHDKILLPTYDVFDERRYFDPGVDCKLWTIGEMKVAVTICEDIWEHSKSVHQTRYDRDPVMDTLSLRPDLIVNLSSSPYSVGKPERRESVARSVASSLNCPVLVCNQAGGNDSLIFDGHSLFLNSSGVLIKRGQGFAEDVFLIDTAHDSTPCQSERSQDEELFDALVLGVRDYFQKQGFKKALIGISGGIDSALVAAIAVRALGKENVHALSLPSRFTTPESLEDAKELIDRLGITSDWISIEPYFETFLTGLGPYFKGREVDHTEENLQARIRAILLMAFSNKFGAIVLSTGNKSEMAMGYSTLYGDMAGGLGVLTDVTKEQVYRLADVINQSEEIIPKRILTKAPSAELKENQKDTDSLPEYPIVDAVLEDYIVFHKSPETISRERGLALSTVEHLIQRIHQNEYKRRQGPPGLRISEKSFSKGRHFPIVQKWE